MKTTKDPALRLTEIEDELDKLEEVMYTKEQNDPYKDMEDFPEAWRLYQEYMKPEWDKHHALSREKRMLMTPKYSSIPEYGDVMSLEHFIECVHDGVFIDYDGNGNYVDGERMTNITIIPSDVLNDSVRDDFDTIIWFNR